MKKAYSKKGVLAALCLLLIALSGCEPSFDWGYIEYDHTLTNSMGGFEQTIRVTGNIGFNSKAVAGGVQTAMYRGVGTLPVTITGTAEECTISGSATNEVSFDGTEFLGSIVFETTEIWYVGGSFTVTCPEDEPQEVPLPSQTITQQIKFPVQDGAVYEQPYQGAAGSGTYRWVLHIER